MPYRFLEVRAGRHVFEFECPGCGVTGEVGIPTTSTKLIQHECGTLFIQHLLSGTSLYGKPRLEEVKP